VGFGLAERVNVPSIKKGLIKSLRTRILAESPRFFSCLRVPRTSTEFTADAVVQTNKPRFEVDPSERGAFGHLQFE
jgi:hypothetical protein